MNGFKNASVILGAVTESDSLLETVDTVLSLCHHEDLAEFLIVYSPHATEDCHRALKALSQKDCDVPLVIFEQHSPRMKSIADGMDAAKGSHCILLASDMALDLDCVPKMIEGAKREPDTIFSCSRWLPGCKLYDYGRVRRLLNFLAQRYLRVLYHCKLTDFTIPVQIAPTELYRAINWENDGFPFLLEMVLKPLRLGYKFVEIPTNCYPRREGRSSNSLGQTLSYLGTSLHIRFMSRDKILRPGAELRKQGR